MTATSPAATTQTAPPETADPFHGPRANRRRWQALAVLFFAQMTALGSISYGFSVLLKPLAADFGLPRATVNWGLMTVLIGMAAFAPVVGRALDRMPGRRIVMIGAVLFAAGWAAIAHSTSVIGALLAAFFLLAPGGTALGPVVASTLISRWFSERRGLALGISAVAMSTGGVIAVPILAMLIEGGGWRNAVTIYGLTGAGIILLLALRVLPAAYPAPRPAGPVTERAAEAAPETEPQPWAQRDFWLIAGAVGLIIGSNGALLSCLVAYATDRGFSLAQGTALVSLVSGGAVVGKLALGALSDRNDARWLYLVVVGLNVLLLGTLLAQPAYPVLFAIALLSGAAVGGAMPLWTVMVGRRFGLAHMGRAMGLMSTAMLPFNLGGLHLVGATYDASGSYATAFQLFLGAVLLAGLLVLPVKGIGRPTPLGG